MNDKLAGFGRIIDYTFAKPALLKQALTHCSMGTENYERFEFLGDSILSFIIAHQLFHQFPDKSEGELSRLRSYLVRGDMLADVAREINLGDYLYLGQGELKSGGFRRASILADSLEAVFAAVYLDGGFDAIKSVILKLYHSRLYDFNFEETLKDAKTRLQEYLQSTKQPLPDYVLNEVIGEEHDQIFYVTCSIPGTHHRAKGQGPTRKKAEQTAAQTLLENKSFKSMFEDKQ